MAPCRLHQLGVGDPTRSPHRATRFTPRASPSKRSESYHGLDVSSPARPESQDPRAGQHTAAARRAFTLTGWVLGLFRVPHVVVQRLQGAPDQTVEREQLQPRFRITDELFGYFNV